MRDVLLCPEQVDLFSSKLPYKPYCSNDLNCGLKIRTQNIAIKQRYIQHNPPAAIAYLVFDIDRPDSACAWSDANLPIPAWVAVNPDNGHSHIVYGLTEPVARTDAARVDPLRYVAAIEAAYSMALDADRGYAKLVTKNPLHRHWRTYTLSNAANSGYYELSTLAEYVELPKKLPERQDAVGLGRNVSIFDNLRKWAYNAVRSHWRPNGFSCFSDAVTKQAVKFNQQFLTPLPLSEIRAIAKSISKWTWRNMSPSSFQGYVTRTHSSEIQSARGKRGGRPVTTAKTKPWESESISRATWYRRQECPVRQKPISDDSL